MHEFGALKLGNIIYESPNTVSARAAFYGEYDGQSVVTKRGNATDERLLRELAVLQSVDCVGIPRPIAYIKDRRHFLVMECLPGTPLTKVIELGENWRSRRLRLDKIIRIVDDVAQCLEALHEAQYLYRDMNLAHILLDDVRIGLVDMERCVRMDNHGVARLVNTIGTRETMAPEEFRVGNPMTVMSNTYTLGIVLCQLATGYNPFFVSPGEIANGDVRYFATRDLHQQLPLAQTNNAGLDTVITKALQPAPSKRYQSVPEFRGALQQLMPNTST